MASRFMRFATTLLALLMATPAGAQLVISEFRLHGAGGDSDEYIEIHNRSTAPHTVSGGGGGYAVVTSDGTVRGVIPNGVVIPGKGHYLLGSAAGYSLGNYPAGPNATALADQLYFTNIPNNTGIALFGTSQPAGFILANRLDAVGPSSETNPVYREGAGYPPLLALNIDHAMVRDACGKAGSITTFGPCPANGDDIDTDDNNADFLSVNVGGGQLGAGQRLGAPGPQNLGSPVSNGGTSAQRLDTCAALRLAPNRVRDWTMDPANQSLWGTVDIRHTFTNTSAANISRLRFRIVDMTTIHAPWGTTELRARTAPPINVTVDRPPCGSGTSDITVSGTTLEQPPHQPNGGGFNSSLSVDAVTPITPLAPGASVDVRFLFGVQQQPGNYRIGLVPEGSPSAGDGEVLMFVGCIDSCASVTSITRASANPTNTSAVSFTVDFSTAMEGVDSSDFVIATTGTLAGAAVTSVTGTGASRTVTVDTGSGDGVLRLHLIDDGSIAAVGGAPPLGGSYTSGEPYTVDRTGPPVTIEQDANQSDPTGTSPVRFIVTFSESVIDFDAADVILGGDAGADSIVVNGFNESYTIDVGGMTGPGTVTASIPAGVVSDVLGNTNTASTSIDNNVAFALVPAAPTSLTAVAGEGQATLTFVVPSDDGGMPILGYTAVCESASGTVDVDGSGSPLLVTGLSNGVDHDCTVLAYNAIGDGPPSNTVAVFPQSVPLAPVMLALFEGDGQVEVHFAPPSSDGGSAILHYDAVCSDGVDTIDATGGSSPILVTGLVNHTTYSCVVLAHNAFGDGPPSAALSVRPPDNLLHEDGFEPVDAF